MHCEFCESALPTTEAPNVALMAHVQESQPCGEQFGYMIDNLNASWTRSMSGP